MSLAVSTCSFTSACAGQLDLETDYCDTRTDDDGKDYFWSYPYTASEFRMLLPIDKHMGGTVIKGTGCWGLKSQFRTRCIGCYAHHARCKARLALRLSGRKHITAISLNIRVGCLLAPSARLCPSRRHGRWCDEILPKQVLLQQGSYNRRISKAASRCNGVPDVPATSFLDMTH